MSKFILDISSLHKEGLKEMKVSIIAEKNDCNEIQEADCSQISIAGSIINKASEIVVFKGEMQVRYKAVCGRCLSELEEVMLIDQLDEQFSKNPIDDQYPYSQDKLDLKKMVQDNIVLNLPIRNVCAGECSILTIEDEVPIDDQTTQAEHPLALLKALLNDNDEEV